LNSDLITERLEGTKRLERGRLEFEELVKGNSNKY
jgi:hypothetical protein